MFWAALLLAGSLAVLVNGVCLVRDRPLPANDDWGDEAHWGELFRAYGWVAVLLGTAGCALAVAIATGG